MISLKVVDPYLIAFRLHNNVASIQKNRGNKWHHIIAALAAVNFISSRILHTVTTNSVNSTSDSSISSLDINASQNFNVKNIFCNISSLDINASQNFNVKNIFCNSPLDITAFTEFQCKQHLQFPSRSHLDIIAPTKN